MPKVTLSSQIPRPQTLTLGFFTPLPLGCSSESCRFLDLFSTGGVSTKLESWGSGVAFNPKGSDYRREDSRNVSRTLAVSDSQAFLPCSGSSRASIQRPGMQMKNPAWAPPLPATSNCSQKGHVNPTSPLTL